QKPSSSSASRGVARPLPPSVVAMAAMRFWTASPWLAALGVRSRKRKPPTRPKIPMAMKISICPSDMQAQEPAESQDAKNLQDESRNHHSPSHRVGYDLTHCDWVHKRHRAG